MQKLLLVAPNMQGHHPIYMNKSISVFYKKFQLFVYYGDKDINFSKLPASYRTKEIVCFPKCSKSIIGITRFMLGICRYAQQNQIQTIYIQHLLDGYLYLYSILILYPFWRKIRIYGTLFWLHPFLILESDSPPKRLVRLFTTLVFLILTKTNFKGIIVHSPFPSKAKSSLYSYNPIVRKFPKLPFYFFFEPFGEFSCISQENARQILNLPTDKTVFLFFGFISKAKGLDVAISAFKNLKESNVVFLIAGELFDYTEAEITALIGDSCQSRFVLYLRFIPENQVKYYFVASDYLLLPYTEVYSKGSTGLISLASSYSTPIIASDLGILGSTIKNFKLGITFDPNSVDDLRNTIQSVLEEENKGSFATNLRKYSKLGQSVFIDVYSMMV